MQKNKQWTASNEIKHSDSAQHTFFLSISFLHPAHAVDIIVKAAIGNKSSELIILDKKFTPDFITLDLSLTGTHDRFFLSINNENSIKDAIEAYTGDPSNPKDEDGLIFGYNFDIANVFVGWRTGETDAYYTGQNNNFGTKSDGFYIGTSSSYQFNGKGTLYGSIAVASLDGEASLTEPFVDTRTFESGNTPPENIEDSAVVL